MKMYRTRWHGSSAVEIEAVEVERTTEKQVVFKNGLREFKRSNHDNYFESFDEAKKFLIEKSTEKLQDLVYRLERAEIELKDVAALSE